MRGTGKGEGEERERVRQWMEKMEEGLTVKGDVRPWVDNMY